MSNNNGITTGGGKNNHGENNRQMQKRMPDSLKEKSQYILAFGVIAMMLLAVGFPTFVIVFFGIFAFFLWKTFATSSPSGVREVFEFYLSANEILRDDERRWFGFEVQEVIARGERILQTMNGAPPLIYFTLGALYHRAGDHKSAVNHLSYVVENENSSESTYNYPSAELRNYVKILRKIEREPAEAPQTSAAVRALERARRNRGKSLLEESRAAVAELNRKKQEAAQAEQKQIKADVFPLPPSQPLYGGTDSAVAAPPNGNHEAFYANAFETTFTHSDGEVNKGEKKQPKDEPVVYQNMPRQSITAEDPKGAKGQNGKENSDDLYNQRKPISEVLNDIYGEK